MSIAAMFLDLSPHQQQPGQPPPDFRAMKAAGIAGVFLRAFEGKDLDEHDRGYSFHQLRWEARAAGLIVGFYQFFRARWPGDYQAGLFCKALGRLEPGELPPVLDVEVNDGQSPEVARDGVLSWVARMRETIGEPPMIYTGPYHWKRELQGQQLEQLADCPLWIADYRTGPPEIPRPWTAAHFWQTTDKASFPGVKGNVDLNVWTGPGEVQAWAERRC